MKRQKPTYRIPTQPLLKTIFTNVFINILCKNFFKKAMWYVVGSTKACVLRCFTYHRPHIALIENSAISGQL